MAESGRPGRALLRKGCEKAYFLPSYKSNHPAGPYTTDTSQSYSTTNNAPFKWGRSCIFTSQHHRRVPRPRRDLDSALGFEFKILNFGNIQTHPFFSMQKKIKLVPHCGIAPILIQYDMRDFIVINSFRIFTLVYQKRSLLAKKYLCVLCKILILYFHEFIMQFKQ